MNNKLYVGNLSYSVRDNDLEEHFSQFGQVTSAKVMMERDTGRSKGFGFVEMATEAEAQAAIDGLHEQPWGGRNLLVNIARPREERPARSFGGGNGGFRGNGGGFGGNGGGFRGNNEGGYRGGNDGYRGNSEGGGYRGGSDSYRGNSEAGGYRGSNDGYRGNSEGGGYRGGNNDGYRGNGGGYRGGNRNDY